MEAKELRIGNWVNAIRYRDDSGKFYPTQIETLSKGWGTINGKSKYTICMNHGFYETGSEWGQTIENENQVKPIPLTEEWLLKFGFEKIRAFMKLKEFRLFYIDGDYEFQLTKNVKVKHVHQLQNLYFSLTGEELIIEE